MRIWPVLLLTLLWASTSNAAPKRKAKAPAPRAVAAKKGKAAPAEKKSVVLSGPASLTKFVSKQLGKRYVTRTLKTPVDAQPTAKEVRDVTAPADAVALLIIQPVGQSFTINVLNGADGTPLDAITVRGTDKKPPKALKKEDLAALMFAVGSGTSPVAGAPVDATPPPDAPKNEPVATKTEPARPEPKPEPARTEPTRAEPTPVADTRTESSSTGPEISQSADDARPPSSLPALRLSVGGGGFNRALRWSGNPSPYLSSANYPFTASISVDGTWYPGAHFTSNFLSNLGLFGAADFGVGMVSRFAPSEGEVARFSASASRIRFGGIVRIPVVERFTAFAHVGYARHEVTTANVAFDDPTQVRPNIPNVLFNGFRGGVGVRLRIVGSLELDAGGSFQTVAGKGEIASANFFPDASAFAVDAGGGLSLQLVDHIRLRAGAEWQRYFLTLHPADDVQYYAQGAVDQYITATASIQWQL